MDCVTMNANKKSLRAELTAFLIKLSSMAALYFDIM